MDGRRERGRTGPGLFLTLVGAGVLVAVGFALGLVVGATWEDPDLLASHLAGRTEEVPLAGLEGSAEGVPVAPPDFAPAPPEPAPGVEPAPEPVAPPAEAGPLEPAPPFAPEPPPLGARTAAAPAPSPPSARSPSPKAARPPAAVPPRPPPVAAAPSGGFSVQVGAFGEERPAADLHRRLAGKGFPAYVDASGEGGGRRWRVRVGPVASRPDAEGLARRLKREQGLPTWVVSDGG